MDTDSDEQYGRGARIIAVVLLVVATGAAIAGIVDGGQTGIAEGVVLLVIAGLLAYGVFNGRLNTPLFQTAFGVGLTAYGSLLYLDGGSLIWLGVTLVGAFLTIENARDLFQDRR